MIGIALNYLVKSVIGPEISLYLLLNEENYHEQLAGAVRKLRSVQ